MTASGEEQLRKIIVLSLLDGDSSNPWNTDAGIPNPAFRLTSIAMKAEILARVKARFKRLDAEHRARLIEARFLREVDSDGTLELTIRYLDLHTDREDEIQTKVTL